MFSDLCNGGLCYGDHSQAVYGDLSSSLDGKWLGHGVWEYGDTCTVVALLGLTGGTSTGTGKQDRSKALPSHWWYGDGSTGTVLALKSKWLARTTKYGKSNL